MRLRDLLFAAMMAGVAVILQTGPVWASEPAGYALSIFACLPPAMAAAAYPRAAVAGAVVAALLCALISPQEAIIFGLTNGLFGLAVGITARAGFRPVRSVLLPAAVLFAGMALLTWGAGVAALGDSLLERGVPFVLALYAGFALLWATLFAGLFRLIHRRVLARLGPWEAGGQTDPK